MREDKGDRDTDQPSEREREREREYDTSRAHPTVVRMESVR